IVGNNADVRGGGLYSESSVITFKNNIMWENSAPDHPEIWIDYRNPLIEYCNIQGGGWEGEGNIDINPQFRDIYNGDYHLKFEYCGDDLNSPCIDAGDPSIYDSEVNCNWGLGQYRSDMGAYGGGSQPIITVGMMPDNFPVVVPAGGSFTYEGSLTNHTEEEMNVDVWIRVRTPDGNYIEINRWQNLTVAPGETNTYYPVVQDIPESAPSGD
ncbi:MAG: hypothetical protein GY839_17955, partial [candidate division Zixibacteria bacterium]|nr:hypothetical protein [candidate division Zixibacteria bacterium]